MLNLKKIEPGVWISGGLHAAALAFLLFGLPATSFPDAEEGIAVDVISEDMLGQITRGYKNAKQVLPDAKPEATRVSEVTEKKDNREDKQDLPSMAKRPEDVPVADKSEPAESTPPPPPPPPPPQKDPEPKKPSAEELEAMLKQQQEAELAEQKRKAEQEKQRQIAEQKRKEAELEKQRKLAEQKRQEAEQEKQRQLAEQKRKELEKQKQRQLAEQKRKEQEAKEAKARSDAQLAKLLDDASSTLNNSKEASQSTGSSAREINRSASLGTATGSAAKLSPSMAQQLSGLIKEQVTKCWTVPVAIQSVIIKPVVRVKFSVQQDGTLVGKPEVFEADGTPELASLLGESAIRAVQQCTPLKIPAQFAPYYSTWKELRIRFDPSEKI